MTPDDIKNITETLQMISQMTQEKPNEWLPLYAALGGAVAGAIASFFPTLLLERHRENNQSRRLLASLITEIHALVKIIEHRNYQGAVKDIIAHLKTQPPASTYAFTVAIPKHYSRIYQENCGRIGSVTEFYAKRIVIFHQLIDSIVQDIQPGGVISGGGTLKSFEEADKLFTQAIAISNELFEAHNKAFKRDAKQHAPLN